MATLQVKGLDERLYGALKARASIDHRSISQAVVAMIGEFLAQPTRDPGAATRAFLELAGTWADERPAGEITREIRKARRSGRRFRRALRVPA